MAARKQRVHPDIVRERIQTSQLINRLQAHAFSGVPLMDASQVNAAKALINKVLPDLSAATVNTKISGTLVITHGGIKQ